MRRPLAVVAACMAVAACDQSSREITSPDAGPVTHSVESFAAGHRMLRPDGSVLFSPASGPAPRFFAAAPTQGTTTTCNQGALVPDDVDPTIIRPEGGLSGGTYDNIEVPPNAVCVLDGVTVTHSVRALAGAYLFVFGSTVGGDILGLAPKAVQLNDETTVGGDFAVTNAAGDLFATCSMDNSTVHGDVACTGNNPGSPIIRAEGGPVTIDGSVSLENNTIVVNNVLLLQSASVGRNAGVNKNTGVGFKGVNGNTVANTLECKKNDPTFTGGPNTANKVKGQCF